MCFWPTQFQLSVPQVKELHVREHPECLESLLTFIDLICLKGKKKFTFSQFTNDDPES